MALSAKFRNNVGQAHDQYSAGESGTGTPIGFDAICAVKSAVFEISITLVPNISEVLRMQDKYVLRLQPRRSISNRKLHRIPLFDMVSLGLRQYVFNTYV